MKNLLTLMALLISASGVLVTLAKDEVRCYLGLESAICPSTPQNQPVVNPSPVVVPSPETTQASPAPETSPSNPPAEVEPDIGVPLEVIPAPE